MKILRVPCSRYIPRSMFPRPRFPPYVLGYAYLKSRTSVRKLLAAIPGVPYLTLEDVYTTGLLATRAGIERIHHPHFHTRLRDNYKGVMAACRSRDVTVHHVKPYMMKKCHGFFSASRH